MLVLRFSDIYGVSNQAENIHRVGHSNEQTKTEDKKREGESDPYKVTLSTLG